MGEEICSAFLRRCLENRWSEILSVSACRNGEMVYHFHDKGEDKPEYACLTEKTKFNVGSVTKIFTGALVLKLVEQGLITLNMPVKSIIPEFAPGHITLRHLMLHISGFTKAGEYGIDWPKTFPEIKDYFDKIYAITEPDRPPEEVEVYFTYGYAILLDVLQRVTGREIEELGQEYLFQPLGMEDTTFDVRKVDLRNCIMPHSPVTNTFLDFSQTPPTGESGLFSTTNDLLKFGKLILDAVHGRQVRLFSPATFSFMLREATNGKFSKAPIFWMKTGVDRFGCFADLSSPSAVGHPGFSGCILVVDPEYDFSYSIITNNTCLDWSHYRAIGNVLLSNLL